MSDDVPQLPGCCAVGIPFTISAIYTAPGPPPCFPDVIFGLTFHADETVTTNPDDSETTTKDYYYFGSSGKVSAKVYCAPFLGSNSLALDWKYDSGACSDRGFITGASFTCVNIGAPGTGIPVRCCPGGGGSPTGLHTVTDMLTPTAAPPELTPAPCDDPCSCSKPKGPPCAGHCPPQKPNHGPNNPPQPGSPPSKGPQPKRKTSSSAPIRYASGEINVAATDVASGGYGVPWGHTRSFASRQSVNETIGQGFCWKVQEWSYLIAQLGGSVIIQGRPNSSLWFAPQANGMYAPLLGIKQTLAFDSVNDVYRLTHLDGTVTVYDGFSGAFLSQSDPAGNSDR